MGSDFSKLISFKVGKKKPRFLILGLDSAGKTSLLFKFDTHFQL